MVFPDDTVMLTLLSISVGQEIGEVDGRLTLEVPREDGQDEPMPIADLDAALVKLINLEWVRMGDGDEPTPMLTSKGEYALKRFMAPHIKAQQRQWSVVVGMIPKMRKRATA